MSDISDVIEKSFRGLLETRRYKSISVKDICEDAHISRKTFYATFHDKEDIVRHVFERDVIGPLHQINSVFTLAEAGTMIGMIQRKIYERIQEDGSYYKDLVKPMRAQDETFLRVATKAIYSFNRGILDASSVDVDEVHADYIAYFFASSQAMLMQKWICDDFALSPDELAELYSSMSLDYWHKLAKEHV